jgi:hypothetical protein
MEIAKLSVGGNQIFSSPYSGHLGWQMGGFGGLGFSTISLKILDSQIICTYTVFYIEHHEKCYIFYTT